MSRWPRGIDAAYLQHESDERLRRVLALDVRYGSCAKPARPVRVTYNGIEYIIVDGIGARVDGGDPGDEHPHRSPMGGEP